MRVSSILTTLILCCLRGHRVGGDGGRRVVLHVPAGQLEPGFQDDGGPLQTQQPGIRRQALHHRRPGRVRKPGPRGEVGRGGGTDSHSFPQLPNWKTSEQMNADSLNKYSHYTAEKAADGGARAGTVRHIAKVTGRVSCKSRGPSNARARRCVGTNEVCLVFCCCSSTLSSALLLRSL